MVAALFDLDGVLLDSERPTKTVWEQLLPHSQSQLWERCLGVNQELEQRTFQSILGWSADDYLQFIQEVKQHLPSTFSLRRGAVQLLKNLRGNGCATAIVTSRNLLDLPHLLDTYDWLELINNIDLLVTGDLGLPSKPDPAPYRFAVDQLSMPSNRCVAIEDAPNGVMSAVAAGIQVVALEDTVKHDTARYKKSVVVLEKSLFNDVEQIVYKVSSCHQNDCLPTTNYW